MFTHSVDTSTAPPVVRLQGSLTLEHCREILTVLNSADMPRSYDLDLHEATAADVSFLQILLALLRTAELDVRFFPLPPHIMELAAAVGAGSLINDIASRTKDDA